MLKINPDPQFSADVAITEPGKKDPAVVRVTFRYKNRKEAQEFIEKHENSSTVEALQEIIVGWEGIDAECTPENIEALVNNYHPAGIEILGAYYKELSASRVKN